MTCWTQHIKIFTLAIATIQIYVMTFKNLWIPIIPTLRTFFHLFSLYNISRTPFGAQTHTKAKTFWRTENLLRIFRLEFYSTMSAILYDRFFCMIFDKQLYFAFITTGLSIAFDSCLKGLSAYWTSSQYSRNNLFSSQGCLHRMTFTYTPTIIRAVFGAPLSVLRHKKRTTAWTEFLFKWAHSVRSFTSTKHANTRTKYCFFPRSLKRILAITTNFYNSWFPVYLSYKCIPTRRSTGSSIEFSRRCERFSANLTRLHNFFIYHFCFFKYSSMALRISSATERPVLIESFLSLSICESVR